MDAGPHRSFSGGAGWIGGARGDAAVVSSFRGLERECPIGGIRVGAIAGELGFAGILLQVGDGTGCTVLSSTDDADSCGGAGGGYLGLWVLVSWEDECVCKTVRQYRVDRTVGGTSERDGLGGLRAGAAGAGTRVMC